MYSVYFQSVGDGKVEGKVKFLYKPPPQRKSEMGITFLTLRFSIVYWKELVFCEALILSKDICHVTVS